METYKKQSKIKLKKNQKIIVIGDLHGDIDNTINILKLSKCISLPKSELLKQSNYDLKKLNKIKWIGGDTIIVQLGDILDGKKRDETYSNFNDNEFYIINLFTKLRLEAQKKKGNIYLLVGNHELLNFIGNFNHVSLKGIMDFGGIDKRFTYLKPGGPYCKKMADIYKAILIIDKYIFVHGSISSYIFQKYTVTKINNLLKKYLLNKKNYSISNEDISYLFYNTNTSPLWSRYFSKEITPSKCIELNKILKNTNTNTLFVGHTFKKEGIQSNCDGKIWYCDVGISGAFNKANIQCVQILNKVITVLK